MSDVVLGASPNCFLEFHAFTAYRYLAGLGIRHVEVPATPGGTHGFAPELIDVGAFRDRLTDMGVQALAVGAYCNLTDPVHVGLMLRRIDFARALGATRVVSDATRQLSVDDETWRKLVNTLRHVGDYAADRDVKIALETHGGLTRNGGLCRNLLDAVDHPAIGINYDTANIIYYNDDLDPAEDVKQIADRVVMVHLKDTTGGKGDWLFCPLGEGRVRFPAVLESLEKAGFAGPYSLEIEGLRGEDNNRQKCADIVTKSLDYLKSIGMSWKSDAPARKAAGLQVSEEH